MESDREEKVREREEEEGGVLGSEYYTWVDICEVMGGGGGDDPRRQGHQIVGGGIGV